MADLLHPDEGPDDETLESPIDPGDFVIAETASDRMEADLLREACDEAGIPSIVQSPRSGLVGTIASPVEVYSILVPVNVLARAKTVLQERKEALEADPAGAERAAEEEEAAGEAAGLAMTLKP